MKEGFIRGALDFPGKFFRKVSNTGVVRRGHGSKVPRIA